MKVDNEIIFFDFDGSDKTEDSDFFDRTDGSEDSEDSEVKKEGEKKVIKKVNSIGLTEDEILTLYGFLFLAIFFILFCSTLCGYSYWYIYIK
jgi:hypothetical protein